MNQYTSFSSDVTSLVFDEPLVSSLKPTVKEPALCILVALAGVLEWHSFFFTNQVALNWYFVSAVLIFGD